MSKWTSIKNPPSDDRRVLVRVPSAVRSGDWYNNSIGIYFGRFDRDLNRWRIEGMGKAPEVDLWCDIPAPPKVSKKYVRSRGIMPVEA